MEDFIAAAIASNDLQGAIECLACLPLTATDVFLGVGHAVMRETWTWPISSIQRGLLTDTIKGIFQLKQVESLPWLLNLWARYMERSVSSREPLLCEMRPFDKYAEDLSYAIKIASLSAVKYLLQRANKIFKFSHVLEAIKAWHPQKPTSADIMERTLSLWLDTRRN
ncbi:hypothetical protein Ae201684P_004579 [Aphanomyces euteiches]|nr:hypothetical protein Ae201684P_004579 [Aphanomyces euteiches]